MHTDERDYRKPGKHYLTDFNEMASFMRHSLVKFKFQPVGHE